jgi:hypothetical protein
MAALAAGLDVGLADLGALAASGAAFALAFDAGFTAGKTSSTGGSLGAAAARGLAGLAAGVAEAFFGFDDVSVLAADFVAIESTPWSAARLSTLPELSPAFYSFDHRILP